MRALWAVYKRETALYFKSFIAYGIAFALMFFVGVFFQATLASVAQSSAQGGAAPPAADLAAGNLNIFIFLLFLISPLMSMRLLSEEAREGTLEVLMTLPMHEWVFIVGKFLAVWTFYTFILGLTLVHVVMLAQLGPINPGIFFVAYLGAWLYGGTTLAVCLIWSAVTEDQLVAAFLGATTVLILFLADQIGPLMGSGNAATAFFAEVVRELGLRSHFHSTMLDGLLRAEDIAYYVLMITVSLFITTLIIGARRWRAS
jgi:gliding motility-associated transport system permease protein